MLKHLLFFLILIGGSYYYWTTRPVVHGPGVIAPKEPIQKNAFGVKTIEHKSYKLTPLARFDMEVRVLSKKRYDDYKAEIAPYDFVVGWGPMSDERNLDYVLIKQSGRSFDWEMTKPPIPQHEMRYNAANMHMVPSSPLIRDKMREVRRGHIIKVKGYLVKISSNEGWELESSLSRKDMGDNSSEVVWIEEFNIL